MADKSVTYSYPKAARKSNEIAVQLLSLLHLKGKNPVHIYIVNWFSY